jgi:hypothetical protein
VPPGQETALSAEQTSTAEATPAAALDQGNDPTDLLSASGTRVQELDAIFSAGL